MKPWNQLTQTEILRKVKRAYIIEFKNERWGVYVEGPEGLDILWPLDANSKPKPKDLLPGQVYSKREPYPAYHFNLSYGYDLARVLKGINPDLEVLEIKPGFRPSNSSL